MGEQPPHTGEGESEFEWTSFEESTPASGPGSSGARTLGRKLAVVAMVVLVALGGTTLLSTSATAQTSFTANDVQTTSHNGQLKELSIAPEGTVSYEGLENPATGVTVTVAVKQSESSTWTDLQTKEVGASGLHGSADYSFDKMSLIKGGPFNKKAFRPDDGETVGTDVDVRVTVTVHEDGGEDVVATGTDTFTVTVENIERGAGVGGKGKTNAN
jgi:hypothetical protein